MLDRGLRARLRPGGRARGARRPTAAGAAGAPRPARAGDLHDRSGRRARLRRRDLGRAHRRAARVRVWVHIADVGGIRRAGVAARPRGAAARDERVRAGSRRADAARRRSRTRTARWCRGGPPGGHASSSSSTARACVAARFTRSLIRSDERLDYDRVDRIFAGARAGRASRGRLRSRPRARRPRALGERADAPRRPRARSGSEPEFSFDRAGTCQRDARAGADRVPPADRASDDRRQRAGREASRRARRADPLPRARGARSAACRAARRALASLGVPTPPVPRAALAVAGGRAGRPDLAGGRALRATRRSRQAGASAR